MSFKASGSSKEEIEEEFAMDKYIGIASRDWGGTVTRTSWINGKKTTE